ncbi:MAG: hypothetical protein KME11_05045 [Timaviella obliquedivisa GSE-PSE-MK23-08B]|jgi:hypothetical protein|nr:hypothetical protein [Timaviella obliquedivisa GSE-PSE-MK23-08B]
MVKTAAQGFATEEAIALIDEKPTTPYTDIKTEMVLLKAFPGQLPIGWFTPEGEKLTTYTVKPYTGEDELFLSGLTTRFRDKVSDILPHFLARMIDTIGDIPVREVAQQASVKPNTLFENFYLADALTMLLSLRLENFGKEIQIQGQCPACQTVNKDREGEYSDLSSTEIEVAQGMNCPHVEVFLPTGAKVFDDMIKRVILRPIRMYDMKRLAKQDDKRAKLRLNHELLMHTVVGIPESEAYGKSQNSDRSGISELGVESLFKALNARDRDYLLKAVGKLGSFGPGMQMDMGCRNCGFEYKAEVPWRDIPSFLTFADSDNG